MLLLFSSSFSLSGSWSYFFSNSASGAEGPSFRRWDTLFSPMTAEKGRGCRWIFTGLFLDLTRAVWVQEQQIWGRVPCWRTDISPNRYSSVEMSAFVSVGRECCSSHPALKQLLWTIPCKCLFLFSDYKGIRDDHLSSTIRSISKARRGALMITSAAPFSQYLRPGEAGSDTNPLC